MRDGGTFYKRGDEPAEYYTYIQLFQVLKLMV
jgi:hypothetical protein